MTGKSRLAVLALVTGVLVLTALPVLATEQAPAEEAPAEEAPAEEQPPVTTDIEPAVPVTNPPASESTPDWTYRYMIPTAIVLALLIVLVTTVQYFTSVVRKRYRIVRE